jgi:hypothetical protein
MTMTRQKGLTTDQANHGGAPSRKQGAKRSVSEDVNFAGWANYTIPDDARGGFNEWAVSDEFLLDMDEVVANGIKLSVGLDKDGRTYAATAFDRNPNSPNAGMMTSQRSGTAWRATAKLVFAIARGMGEEWSRWSSEGREDW